PHQKKLLGGPCHGRDVRSNMCCSPGQVSAHIVGVSRSLVSSFKLNVVILGLLWNPYLLLSLVVRANETRTFDPLRAACCPAGHAPSKPAGARAAAPGADGACLCGNASHAGGGAGRAGGGY